MVEKVRCKGQNRVGLLGQKGQCERMISHPSGYCKTHRYQAYEKSKIVEIDGRKIKVEIDHNGNRPIASWLEKSEKDKLREAYDVGFSEGYAKAKEQIIVPDIEIKAKKIKPQVRKLKWW